MGLAGGTGIGGDAEGASAESPDGSAVAAHCCVEGRSDLYLVSTSNPDGVFLEQRTDNNTAWQRFGLTGKGTGNRKLTLLEHSDCESPALCGAFTANRG